ncbi:MAG TPA: MFS transporter [Xanthobacteraceae bacterium]|nr:MFS transporter [Xanthobacteraceae bacterium]
MNPARTTRSFHGWRVVAAAFILAVFGWGMGFYGPPVFLQAVRTTRGWPLALISTAVTVHFLVGAVLVANLTAFYRRFGMATVTRIGALSLAIGIIGWAIAAAPWQLFVATLFSGAGWAATSAAAINAIVSPWFIRARPAALAMAYNGASIGGVVFSPLWVAAIGLAGFPLAAVAIGLVMALTIWVLAGRFFARTPGELGLHPDGDAASAPSVAAPALGRKPQPALWRDLGFVTLAVGMALGLFAQIGLLAHLFSLLVPALGSQWAGLVMGGATGAAIGGRTFVGWFMPAAADRRLVACANYGVQVVGSIALIAAAGTNVPLLLAGVLLFGVGIGNATSLPPLIAQAEFAGHDVARVVSLVVATSQAAYAFAPATFGLIRQLSSHGGDATLFYAAAAVVQVLAIAAFLIGRRC